MSYRSVRRGPERGDTELELQVHHETSEAWLVSPDGDEDEAVWLPKSKVRRGERTSRSQEIYAFEVPTWLAQEKGLV